MKRRLGKFKREILTVLVEHDFFLTTTQVADIAGVSWSTAKRYLEEMGREGWVIKIKRKNRLYWTAAEVEE